MVDTTNPADPSGGGSTTTADLDERASLRRNRWLATEVPAAPPPQATWAVTWAPVFLVVAIGTVLRLYRIGAQPLWLDEASSLRFARLSLAQLWSWSSIVDPGNPPLYYSVLHGWLRFGDSEAALRIPSMVFGVLTIPLVYALGRTIRDHRLGIVAALLFAISPFQVWYSQEARGYSLLTLGATSAMLGVAYLLRHPERSGTLRATGWALLAYVFGTTVALLAHDTAVFLPIGANVLMLGWWWTHGREPRGFLRNWLLAQVAVLCLWASWLPAYLHQVADGGAYSWIPRPTVGSVLSGAYAVYAGVTRATPYPLEAVVVLALAALGLWSWKQDRRWIAFVLVFGLSALLGELIVSLWRPIFLTQTLIWAAVPLTWPSPRDCCACGRASSSPRSRSSSSSPASVSGATTSCTTRRPGTRSRRTWTTACSGETRSSSALASSTSPSTTTTRRRLGIRCRRWSSSQGTPKTCSPYARRRKTSRRVWLIVSHPKTSTDAVISSLEEAGRLVGVAQFTDVDVYLYEIG